MQACRTTKQNKRHVSTTVFTHFVARGPASRRQQSCCGKTKCAKGSLHVFLVKTWLGCTLRNAPACQILAIRPGSEWGRTVAAFSQSKHAAPAAILLKTAEPDQKKSPLIRTKLPALCAQAWGGASCILICERKQTSDPPDQEPPPFFFLGGGESFWRFLNVWLDFNPNGRFVLILYEHR